MQYLKMQLHLVCFDYYSNLLWEKYPQEKVFLVATQSSGITLEYSSLQNCFNSLLFLGCLLWTTLEGIPQNLYGLDSDWTFPKAYYLLSQIYLDTLGSFTCLSNRSIPNLLNFTWCSGQAEVDQHLLWKQLNINFSLDVKVVSLLY